jgi:hypothetical protein
MHAALFEHVVIAKARTPAAIALKSELTKIAATANAATKTARLTMRNLQRNDQGSSFTKE